MSIGKVKLRSTLQSNENHISHENTESLHALNIKLLALFAIELLLLMIYIGRLSLKVQT